MNLDDIKAKLQSVIQTFTSVTTIYANQNAPIPDKPFITLLVTVTNKIGHDEPVQVSDTQQEYAGQREFDVSIQCFGDTSYQTLLNLHDYFETALLRDSLATSGIVYVSNEGITNIDEILDTEIEHRASMNVLFRIDSTTLYDSGIIEQADVTQTIYNPDGTVANNDNYLIS